jgi:hypothetical protein
MSDTTNIPPRTAALADEEVRQLAERKKVISNVLLEVEAILIREKVTFREWQTICASFMDRQMRIAEDLTIEEAKNRFDGITN